MDEEGGGPSPLQAHWLQRETASRTPERTLTSMPVDVCRAAAPPTRQKELRRPPHPCSSPQAGGIVRPCLVAPRSTAANPSGPYPTAPRSERQRLRNCSPPQYTSAREGPAPFWSFPRRGAGARAPQRARRNHSHPFASHHEGSAAGFALHPTRGKPKGAVSPSRSPFAPAALCNGPLPPEPASPPCPWSTAAPVPANGGQLNARGGL